MFKWATGNTYALIVTVYPTNLTLNTPSALKLKDARYCMLGIDVEKKQAAIKAVNKEEIDLGLVPLENLHRISYGKGYARISNKSFIADLGRFIDIKDEGVKLPLTYDESEKMLIMNIDSNTTGGD